MFPFDPNLYGPEAAALLDSEHVAELGPGKPEPAARARLERLTPESLFPGKKVVDRNLAQCCLAALWLEYDFLDESHAISQEVSTTEGSYWHGIMHRREPDFSNAKYWFRRVGEHPVFGPLAESARELAQRSEPTSETAFLTDQERWDPYRFIDLCEAAAGDPTNADLCRRIAQEEWRLLFDYCYRGATGDY